MVTFPPIKWCGRERRCNSEALGSTELWAQRLWFHLELRARHTVRWIVCLCEKLPIFTSSSLTQPNRGFGTSGGAPTELGIALISVLFSVRGSCSYPVKSFVTVKIEFLYKITRVSTGPREGELKRGKQLGLSHDLCHGVIFWFLQLH